MSGGHLGRVLGAVRGLRRASLGHGHRLHRGLLLADNLDLVIAGGEIDRAAIRLARRRLTAGTVPVHDARIGGGMVDAEDETTSRLPLKNGKRNR